MKPIYLRQRKLTKEQCWPYFFNAFWTAILCGILAACRVTQPVPAPVTATPTTAESAAAGGAANAKITAITLTATTSPIATLPPDDWMTLPVLPETVSERANQIYADGQQRGNQPNVFSIIGDCDATPTWFLGDFDLGPKYYNLGEFTDLQDEIDYFHGSFARPSLAVRRGFVAASVLTPLWADPKVCEKGETPLTCEIRVNKPAYAFILLGTNDYNHREVFEKNMRKILDTLIANGVLPILGTKADNMEGDYTLNATIAALAREYDLPLWNFWAATQPLPAHGLEKDKTHLTWAANDFSKPSWKQSAWPWRNLTALQTLSIVRDAVK